MRLADLLRSARPVAQGRARAALTLLGVVIGTGSIVLLASLLRGGEGALIQASQQAAEADLIQVRRDEVRVQDRRRTRRELSREDARALSESSAAGELLTLSESVKRTEAIGPGGKKKPISLVSATPAALSLYRLEVGLGRFLGAADLEERRRVCVVGHEVWEQLFGGRRELAGDVRITAAGHAWTVIGVLEERPILGSTDSTNIWDRKVLVPETTYDALLSPEHDADRIYVRRDPAAAMKTPLSLVRSVVDATLRRRHLGVKNYKIEDEASRGQERLILDVIKLLLLSTGLIALFVGGINIMNIMLVTVAERTREIGIRRAVGASPRAILAQFLIEAAVVSLTGGLLGVVAGVGLSWVAALVLTQVVAGWAFHVEGWSVGLGLGLSLVTGVAFGFYPALRAARLDPIEALRSE